MEINFKFELGQRVCHHIQAWIPLIVIERLCYDRQGGFSIQYFCRAGYAQEKLYCMYENELDLYKEGAREKMHDEMAEEKNHD
ncbi:hypothetical protein LCGC14_2042470 [marine sediment metagenome]|uniref:Uncharacterized protein n=1 Tax=marine sediment metagenome TaxID=412755 RepID=A0A0F9ERA8_9ZZZZ